MKAQVMMITAATHYVNVEIPDDTPEDERFDAAVAEAEQIGAPGLCHQCAHKWELGQEEVPSPDAPPFNISRHDIVTYEG